MIWANVISPQPAMPNELISLGNIITVNKKFKAFNINKEEVLIVKLLSKCNYLIFSFFIQEIIFFKDRIFI